MMFKVQHTCDKPPCECGFDELEKMLISEIEMLKNVHEILEEKEFIISCDVAIELVRGIKLPMFREVFLFMARAWAINGMLVPQIASYLIAMNLKAASSVFSSRKGPDS